MNNGYKVYYEGYVPGKKMWFKNLFLSQKEARDWCKVRRLTYKDLTIVDLEGKEEIYKL